MASYSLDEFVGDGRLKGLIPKFLEGGWDDVPTLKMMNADDMDIMKLTQEQKDALELRSYLHDRSLMEYGDRLEASRKPLTELLTLSTLVLSSQYGLKKGHINRFVDRETSCRVSMPSACVLPARQRTMSSVSRGSFRCENFTNSRKALRVKSSNRYEESTEQSMTGYKLNEGYVFKGIVATQMDESMLCGCLQPRIVVDEVAPYSSIEKISVEKLMPEYKIGMEGLVKAKAPPMKASDLWREKPVILLCVRRPGCIMCRAEAHQLYARKPIFDGLGFQLIAVLHEHIESEVRDFWPRYWGGAVILDRSMNFFKALGGGKLLKDRFLTGFLLNPRAISNYKRARATEIDNNFTGNGSVKGGLFIIGRGKSGVSYQFIERNFGDWAPVAEIVDICSKLQNGQSQEVIAES